MEQALVSDIFIDFLETLYPRLSSCIDVVDEMTPLSYDRYSSNWQGFSCGRLLARETLRMMMCGLDKRLPGLNDFCMAEPWVEPGAASPFSPSPDAARYS